MFGLVWFLLNQFLVTTVTVQRLCAIVQFYAFDISINSSLSSCSCRRSLSRWRVRQLQVCLIPVPGVQQLVVDGAPGWPHRPVGRRWRRRVPAWRQRLQEGCARVRVSQRVPVVLQSLGPLKPLLGSQHVGPGAALLLARHTHRSSRMSN